MIVHPQPSHRRRPIPAAVAAAVAAAALGGGAGAILQNHRNEDGPTVVAPQAEPAGKSSVAGGGTNGSAEKAAAAVLPSIVTITVSLPDGSGDLGSGIVLSSDGQIMTNNHVVSAAANGDARIDVTFSSGRTTTARVIGRDPVTDLAVIRAKGVHNARPAALGRSSTLAVGQPVVAIGSPLSQNLSGTVTSGIVSALDRPVSTGDGDGEAAQATVIDAIQTDAAINPGNSGGALLDASGRIVGINQSIDPGENSSSDPGNIGIGFAIPIDEARPVVTTLLAGRTPEHARIGVTVADAQTPGAQLREVTDGEARSAGLQAGDVVTRLGGRLIDSGDALVAAVGAHRPGDTVTVTYERNGRTQSTKVTLGSDASD